MSTCPVCGEVQNADQGAFEHHVNSHFDAGPSTPRFSISQEKIVNQVVETDGQDTCPICDFPLSFISPSEAQTHVNKCLDGPPPPPRKTSTMEVHFDDMDNHSLDTTSRDMDFDHDVMDDSTLEQLNGNQDDKVDSDWDGPARPGAWMDWTGKKVHRGDQWWDPVNGSTTTIPSNFSPGIITILAEIIRKCTHQGITKHAVLCRDTVHIKGTWKFDMGWGCGYRNALMSITSLLTVPAYRRLFDRHSNGAEPGVRRVQGWIEEAWQEGFDPAGKKQLKGKILGTRKWIGVADLYAMFNYKGIPCELFDFPKARDTKGSKTVHIALQDWVKAYFSSQDDRSAINDPKSAFDILMRTAEDGAGRGETVRISNKFPLILQHSGHSRTIIGYEENSRGDINLLLFDPGRSMPKDVRALALSSHSRAHGPSISQDQVEEKTLSSLPSIMKKKSSRNLSDTHEAIPFTPPYTNGYSEITYSPGIDEDLSQSSPRVEVEHDPEHTRGGVIPFPLEDDEEISSTGWVTKKKSKSINSNSTSNPTLISVDQLDLLKTVNYFRLNLSSLSKYNQYQILAFTGKQVLSREEREQRKSMRSTKVIL
ncbi:uncharacterized protein IL334_007310 [Kwoniella shivajii]|uniref:UFSP1/2/DUB catalytic domain-containing protein n=1 Tax=Kwoniella shivajii TaxID=564305 RepID=A0ABZ1D8B3_9TREE|nr:hypothetical protein IL334_007310 [Kwoniella shivajii]